MSTTDNGRIPDKTGGSAFPAQFDFTQADDLSRQTGMTLRDYFSGQALQSLLIKTELGNLIKLIFKNSNEEVTKIQDYPGQNIAKWSYEIADAMLTARKDSDEAKAE